MGRMENRLWPKKVCPIYRAFAWQRLWDLHCRSSLEYEIVLRRTAR